MKLTNLCTKILYEKGGNSVNELIGTSSSPDLQEAQGIKLEFSIFFHKYDSVYERKIKVVINKFFTIKTQLLKCNFNKHIINDYYINIYLFEAS